MKKVILTAILSMLCFTAVSAQAQINVTRAHFVAEAFELPEGLIQIFEPKVVVNGNSYYLFPSVETAKAVCSDIGKAYVSASADWFRRDHSDSTTIQFSPEGGMSMHGRQILYLQIVTCK